MKMRAMRSLRVAINPAAAHTAPPALECDADDAGRRGASVAGVTKVQAEIKAMERLDLDELRLQWRNRWGRLPPAHIPRALLFRLMAYRVQAGTFGDLDRQTAAALARMTRQDAEFTASAATVEPDSLPPSSGASSSSPTPDSSARSPANSRRSDPPRILKPGAVMTRAWRGRIERVMVLEVGFAWEGKTFSSLSGVAFAITGVKWNGYRFFFGSQGRDAGAGGGKADGGGAPNRLRRAELKDRRGIASTAEVAS